MCLSCLQFFDLPEQLEQFADHLLTKHHIVVVEMGLIVDPKRSIHYFYGSVYTFRAKSSYVVTFDCVTLKTKFTPRDCILVYPVKFVHFLYLPQERKKERDERLPLCFGSKDNNLSGSN